MALSNNRQSEIDEVINIIILVEGGPVDISDYATVEIHGSEKKDVTVTNMYRCYFLGLKRFCAFKWAVAMMPKIKFICLF